MPPAGPGGSSTVPSPGTAPGRRSRAAGLRHALDVVAVAALLIAIPTIDAAQPGLRFALMLGLAALALSRLLEALAARSRARALEALVLDAAALAAGDGTARRIAAGEAGFESLARALDGIRRALDRDAEQRKRHEDERRSLFDDTHDGVLLSTPDGRIVDANRAAVEILGRASKAELQALRTQDLWIAAQSGEEPVAALIAAQEASGGETEIELRRADGERVAVAAVAARFRDAAGRVSVQRTIFRDLSEQRNLEARLRQTQKLEAVGMLAAGVAHEINNPLTYVLAHLETIQQDLVALAADRAPGPMIESIRARIAEAFEGAGRVKRIVRDFKTFSRLEGQDRAPVDVNAIVERALQLASAEIRYRAKVALDLKPVPRVMADDGRLAQVFLNLLINAAQALPDDGPDRNEIGVRTAVDGEQVLVEVSDTGRGIEPDHLDRIFDPFFTTKAPNEGSGLGLSICYNIVTAYGGHIEVESLPGAGSRFTVRLPAARAQAAAVSPEEEAPIASPRLRVLVVDDEPFVLSTTRMILGRSHDVVCCGSAADALKVLDGDRRFDVILCDLMMYRSSGMDLYAALLERNRELARRMVFMTGGAFTEPARRFLASVPNVRIDKPFGSVELLNVVQRVVAARARAGGARDGGPRGLPRPGRTARGAR